jgi:putative membrane protein
MQTLLKIELSALGNSILYSLLGILILVLAFVIVERLTPQHNLWKEVVEQHNTALAIVAAGFMLSIAIIIASAIH